MRRKDREITDFTEMLKIIAKCDTCRLALFDDEYPYIVPLNFGEDVTNGQLTLYFHCATEGTKLDLIKKNNKASFEMDCEHNILLYVERMSCTMGYESVIGQGEIEMIEDVQEKLHALRVIMRHYHNEEFKFNEKMAEVTAVFQLKVNHISGKRRDNMHPNEKTVISVNLEQ